MQNNILFISGVTKEKTPVLKNLVTNFKYSFNCKFVLYEDRNIFSFIKSSLYSIIKTKEKNAIFFIGFQSLPVLFLVQFLPIKKYYWALENYKFKLFKSSLIQKTLLLEHFIWWKKINLIVPSKYRSGYYDLKKFKNIFIIENTPPLGFHFKKRILNNEKVKFVMYGRLCDEDVYLSEFINTIKKFPNLAELHLIGWDFSNEEKIKQFSNIFFHGQKGHDELLILLDDFHISIIGYRPHSFNNKYCAPNKLYEALSLSMPIIANSLNPPLVDIINEEKCGILTNFDKISTNFTVIINEIKNNYFEYNRNCFDAYTTKYHFDANIANILIKEKIEKSRI